MKKYKSSDLTNHNRGNAFDDAKAGGIIVQECNTNGNIRFEYVLIPMPAYKEITENIESLVADLKGCAQGVTRESFKIIDGEAHETKN